MQRRKIFSNLKNKPKLIIDRERLITRNSDKNDEYCPLSIIKMQPIQDFKKSFNKQHSHHSFSSKKRQRSLKKVNFNIREIPTKENIKISSKTLKQQIAETHQNLHIESKEQFLTETIKKLKYSPHVFCFSGDLTLSSFFMHKTIRLIIEQLSINPIELNNIYIKLKKHFENDQVSTNCLTSKRQIQQNNKSKCTNWKIERYISFKYEDGSGNVEKKQIYSKIQQDKMNVSLNVLQISKTQQLEYSTISHSPLQQEDQVVQQVEEQLFIFEHLRDLNDYIFNQPNKILHDAFRVHKYLEEELFAYADLLSISKFGAKTYTTQIDITVVDANLDREMKNLNRSIIQGTESLDVKCKMLRNFTLTLRQSYNSIVLQLMRVIDKKTIQIKTFVNKTLKWQQNYITRKEYLNNLKIDYCKQIHLINSTLRMLRMHLPTHKHFSLQNLQESIVNIDRIYKLGNSFY